MKRSSIRSLGITSLLLLLIAGCVELSGQRIVMRYEPREDRLIFRLCYDGPFESGDSAKDMERGTGFLKSLLAGEAAMFLNLVYTLPVAGLGAVAAEFEEDGWPAGAELFRALDANTSLRSLGHYRDHEGRVGFAQELRIEQASHVLELLNRVVDEAILKNEIGPEEERWPATHRMVHAAARAGHRWFWFQGHTLRVDLPVPHREWRAMERDFWRALLDDDPGQGGGEGLAALLASGISIEKHSDRVLLRLGIADEPVRLRVPLRRDYVPNLADTVTEFLPAQYDAQLADELLSSDGVSSPAGPDAGELSLPEDRVRALLGEFEAGPGGRADLAAAALARFAGRWNRELRVPRAPAPDLAPALLAEAWREWTRALIGEASSEPVTTR